MSNWPNGIWQQSAYDQSCKKDAFYLLEIVQLTMKDADSMTMGFVLGS